MRTNPLGTTGFRHKGLPAALKRQREALAKDMARIKKEKKRRRLGGRWGVISPRTTL